MSTSMFSSNMKLNTANLPRSVTNELLKNTLSKNAE